MKYKLIAIDMDGTLLNSSNQISPRTRKALNEASKKGVEVIFATGRMLKSALNYSRRLNLKKPIISCNGSLVVDDKEDIIIKNPITSEKIRKIAKAGDDLGIYYHFYTESEIYSPMDLEEITEFYNAEATKEEWIYKYVYDDIEDVLNNKDKDIYKFIFIDEDEKRTNLNKLEERLKKDGDLNITTSWHNNMEVMDLGVSKGNSLKELSKQLNIKQEEIIAIGDNNNDISMIEYAGLGVAMKNGEDSVKEKADLVTDYTNNEDGVADIIEKYILN